MTHLDPLSGVWDVTITTPLGQQQVQYAFSGAGADLSGEARQGGQVTPLLDPALSGDRLTWTQHVTRPMKLTLQFEVVVQGDELRGTARAGALPASRVSGTRRAPQESAP